MSTTAVRSGKTVLKFAILTYPEHSERWGDSWIARSVLTADIAEGITEEDAIESLRRGIETALFVAGRYGMSPQEWYDTLDADEPKYLAAFCRLVPGGTRTRVFDVEHGACRIEASIVTGAAP